jgi:hypothetical protein
MHNRALDTEINSFNEAFSSQHDGAINFRHINRVYNMDNRDGYEHRQKSS